jgi:hypothetical protein
MTTVTPSDFLRQHRLQQMPMAMRFILGAMAEQGDGLVPGQVLK